MRIFILTLGTRGDFELFCTLGRDLRRRGHHVVLGTSGFYAQATEAAGLEWTAIGGAPPWVEVASRQWALPL